MTHQMQKWPAMIKTLLSVITVLGTILVAGGSMLGSNISETFKKVTMHDQQIAMLETKATAEEKRLDRIETKIDQIIEGMSHYEQWRSTPK